MPKGLKDEKLEAHKKGLKETVQIALETPNIDTSMIGQEACRAHIEFIKARLLKEYGIHYDAYIRTVDLRHTSLFSDASHPQKSDKYPELNADIVDAFEPLIAFVNELKANPVTDPNLVRKTQLHLYNQEQHWGGIHFEISATGVEVVAIDGAEFPSMHPAKIILEKLLGKENVVQPVEGITLIGGNGCYVFNMEQMVALYLKHEATRHLQHRAYLDDSGHRICDWSAMTWDMLWMCESLRTLDELREHSYPHQLTLAQGERNVSPDALIGFEREPGSRTIEPRGQMIGPREIYHHRDGRKMVVGNCLFDAVLARLHNDMMQAIDAVESIGIFEDCEAKIATNDEYASAVRAAAANRPTANFDHIFEGCWGPVRVENLESYVTDEVDRISHLILDLSKSAGIFDAYDGSSANKTPDIAQSIVALFICTRLQHKLDLLIDEPLEPSQNFFMLHNMAYNQLCSNDKLLAAVSRQVDVFVKSITEHPDKSIQPKMKGELLMKFVKGLEDAIDPRLIHAPTPQVVLASKGEAALPDSPQTKKM